MSVSRPTGVQLAVSFCSSIPVMLFDTTEFSRYLNTLSQLSPYHWYIIGFICDIFNARNNSWISYEGPAKRFITGFGLLQCYVLSNIFLLQTFEVFPLY